MNRSLSIEETQALRRQMVASVANKRALGVPMDWEWASPILTDSLITRTEQGDPATMFWQPLVSIVKQVGMRLSRKAVVKLFEYGSVDVSNRYAPLNSAASKNTSQPLFQIAFHAYVMGLLDHIAQVNQVAVDRRSDVPGAFEIAADLMLAWVKDDLTVPEMFQGMSLSVTCLDHFPYTHVHAWERVHHAMRATPGISLSQPSRVSLTRLVWEWFRASRPYGREHEIELMSQIDLYGRIEAQVGGDERTIFDLFEIRDLYYKKQTLETKRRSAKEDVEFVSQAAMLGILGGAIPRQQMMSVADTAMTHQVYGARIALADGYYAQPVDPDEIIWID